MNEKTKAIELHEKFNKLLEESDITKRIRHDWMNFARCIFGMSREELAESLMDENNKAIINSHIVMTKLKEIGKEMSEFLVFGSTSDDVSPAEISTITTDLQIIQGTINEIDKLTEFGTKTINEFIKKAEFTDMMDFLFEFIAFAKQNGYGSGSDKAIMKKMNYSTMLNVCDPDNFPGFLYTDAYNGTELFSGSEVVTWMQIPLYSLAYAGVEYVPFDEDETIYDCLCAALKAGPMTDPRNVRGMFGVMDPTQKWIYIVDQHWDNKDYVHGTEYIITVQKYHELAEQIAINGGELFGIMREEIGLKDPTELKWLGFRCDFQGGIIKGFD